MDTKWKKRKIVISFLVFFLGITLTLAGAIGILKTRPSGLSLSKLDQMWNQDYQQTSRFRNYISERLKVFLSMAANLCGQDGYSNSYYYYGSSYNDYYRENGLYDIDYYNNLRYDSLYNDYGTQIAELLRSMEEYQELLNESWADLAEYERILEIMSDLQQQLKELQQAQKELEPLLDPPQENPDADSADDSRDEVFRKSLAQRYHNSIKGDQNLIYSISWDGQELYTNSDLIHPDGSVDSEEYNFLLYFDGQTVKITKDGVQLNVYGDGYYRDDSAWYVPGYRNFPVNENMKKAVICIAAMQTPILYTEGNSQSGDYSQLNNPLYWIYSSHQTRQLLLRKYVVELGLGVLLLIISFFLRKTKREADQGIARIQGKLWVEVKALFLLALLWFLFSKVFVNETGSELLQEITYAYEHMYGWETVTVYGWDILGTIHSLFWIILFWGIYLTVNDLHYNKKIWRQGLIAKLYRTFTARNLKLPLSRKMARRTLAVILAAAVYGILLFWICLLGYEGNMTFGGILIVFLLATALFLAAECVIAAKNMEAARNLEILSRRIIDIRSGNYEKTASDGTVPGDDGPAASNSSPASRPAGDLEDTLSQLEDIRQGMAAALEEQMKSERMKVELIANVSHDIKTPLTSIISYVQFLKQEDGLPEHVKDYVKILDEKSQRLKNMIQDVFAVSKAASGELPIQMEELDFGKLLRQTLADMEEQITECPLTFRTEIPQEPVMILADGQRMYRVFQNLLQNAIKYSLEGSRVYVTLTTDGPQACAAIKNTSQLEPEKGKDFAERFTRGDQSRTDGGSGLGLSIAQSFTEACGGTFAWETNADLFIVTVSFRRITS